MPNFKNTFFLILLISIQILSAKPEPEYTKFSILGGIYGSYNLHSTSFKELPGYTSCCTEFTGGTGMGITFSLGAEYLIDKEIFSGLSYRFVLTYADRSALLSQEEVIGYDIEGVNELVIHNHTGLIVPLLNEKLMAESIIKLIEKPYLIEKYGNNGYNTIIKNFSLNKMIKHHRNYFNSL